ncbi:MAG: hypothetical protein ACLPPF_17345 [Rhodomicrobium sp.]
MARGEWRACSIGRQPVTRRWLRLFLAGLLWPGAAHADDAEPAATEKIEIEHIFGFTEGTDIGGKGEAEFESTTVARFGTRGNYTAIWNESAYRNVITDGLRVSVGGLTDYFGIHDMPALGQRNGFDFSGLTNEYRWQPLDRTNSSIGLALSVAPQWARVDDVSGGGVESYALPAVLAIDAAPIPDKLFAAFNLIYEPSAVRTAGSWEHDRSLEISAATSYAITPEVFVGAELRYLALDERPIIGHGLFAGPSVYWKLSDKVSLKLAWSTQISDDGARGTGLSNIERNQAILLFVKQF